MIHEILLIDDDPIANFINSKIIKNEYPGVIIKKYEKATLALNYIRENPKKNSNISRYKYALNGWVGVFRGCFPGR